MDLVEFLRARLDEDAQVARDAQGGPWDTDETGWDEPSQGAEVRSVPHSMGTVCSGFMFEGDRQHIARHDPARVLAEVEAKRRIVELHADQHECNVLDGAPQAYDYPYPGCSTLRLLALAYAGHSDYQEKWIL